MKKWCAIQTPANIGQVVHDINHGCVAEFKGNKNSGKRHFMYLTDYGQINGRKISAEEVAVIWLMSQGIKQVDIIHTVNTNDPIYLDINRLKMMEQIKIKKA